MLESFVIRINFSLVCDRIRLRSFIVFFTVGKIEGVLSRALLDSKKCVVVMMERSGSSMAE